MYLRPKDSNAAVGVQDCAAQKVPKGMTDRQTFRHFNTLCPKISSTPTDKLV